MTATFISSGAVRGLLEPLIDLMHGDIALGDVCCRGVATAFIHAYDTAVRDLVKTTALPIGVQKAIETYCVRSYLIEAPGLLQKSGLIAQALLNLAQTLEEANVWNAEKSEVGEPALRDEANRKAAGQAIDPEASRALMVSAGKSVVACATPLQLQHDDAHFQQLIAALGDAVLSYAALGSRQCDHQAAAYLDGITTSPGSSAHASYQTVLRGFVVSAAAAREARQRAHAAAQEAEVQKLLFGESHSSAAGDDAHDGAAVAGAAAALAEVEKEEVTEGVTLPPPSPPSPVNFAGEVRAAMDDPAEPMFEKQMQQQQRMLKHPIPLRSHTGRRRLRPANDPVEEDILALEQSTPLPTPQRRSSSVGSRDVEVEKGHASTNDPAASTIHGDSPSPNIVEDPSTLMVEMSAVVSSPPLPNSQDETLSPHAPARKHRRTDPVLIGASETSVLRMMERTDSSADSLPPTSTSMTASVSSTIPFGAQEQELIGGTPTPSPSAAPAVVDIWEDVQRCVRRRDAESRSYFLSTATGRFEPMVAKGFF